MNTKIDADFYKLDESEHQEIRKEHARDYFQQTEISERPTAILLAGQPGAGKSSLTEQAEIDCENIGGAVTVDIDDLRESHPEYTALGLRNDRTASGLVQHDASKWGDELLQDAMKNNRNIILDGPMRSPEGSAKLCRELKANGYRVDVRAMAVRQEDSKLGIHARFEDVKAGGHSGRWVPEQIHDQAYTGMRDSIEKLNTPELTDNVEVYGRSLDGSSSLRTLYKGQSGSGNPVKALDNERARERTPEEQKQFKSDTLRTGRNIIKRDPKLAEPENKLFIHNLKKDRNLRIELSKKEPDPKISRPKLTV